MTEKSKHLRSCSVLMAMAAAVGCAEPPDSPREGPPNVVWIVLDALRAKNLSCYGYERRTSPNLDALAARGVWFEDAFAQYHKTRGSVPQYLTGRYFPVPGFIDYWQNGWRQRPPEERYLAEIMRDNGYRTVMFTSHGFFGVGSRIHGSFDEVNPGAQGQPGNLGALSHLIDRWLRSRDRASPFFLYLHAMETHFPHELKPPFDKWLDPDHPPGNLPYGETTNGAFSAEDQEYLRGLYDGSILMADEQLGELFARLESEGELRRTIIVISSDHGEVLGEDGRTVGHFAELTADEGYHVPLIMAGPGIAAAGPRSGLVQNVDIVPTLVDLLDLRTDFEPDGRSLVPLIEDAEPIHEFIYSKTLWAQGTVHILIDTDAKYVLKTAGVDADGVEELWRIPDPVTSRQPYGGDVEAKLTVMRERIERHVAPKLRAYQALPATETQIFVHEVPYPYPPGALSPPSAFVDVADVSDPADNRWTVGHGRVSSCAYQEDAPPLTMTLEVPNEIYRVEMMLRTEPRGDGRESAASAFLIKAQDDQAFRRISLESATAGTDGFVGLGDYRVDDGVFVVTLDEGEPGACATGGRLQFIPSPFIAKEGISDDRLERLKALGYDN